MSLFVPAAEEGIQYTLILHCNFPLVTHGAFVNSLRDPVYPLALSRQQAQARLHALAAVLLTLVYPPAFPSPLQYRQ